MTIKDESTLEVLNRVHLSEMSFGDEDFEKEIIGDFLEGAPGLLTDIMQATESGSCKLLAQASHTLKGSCRSLGVERLAASCQELESMARGGSFDGARSVIEAMKIQLQDLRSFVREGWGL